MNRTIKFRGLRVDGKGWVYGDLKTNKHLSFISNFDNGVNRDVFEVKPETVGQFTGLLDKNGKEIYEGDVLHSKSWLTNASEAKSPYHVVTWGVVGWKAKGYNGHIEVMPDLDIRRDFEIIGNIHEQ